MNKYNLISKLAHDTVRHDAKNGQTLLALLNCHIYYLFNNHTNVF